MTKQAPFGRYAVYSHDKWQAQFPSAVPAARYDDLEDAKAHADSVTYKMVVIDMVAESRGFLHTNWETTKYRIDRTIPGGFLDYLHKFCPEYADLPTFRGIEPLLFDTAEIAEAVADHLRVWFPSTDEIPGVARSLPITYCVVPVEKLSEQAKGRMKRAIADSYVGAGHFEHHQD